MATLQRIYKGGKKVCETKSKTELVNALYNKSSKKKLGKCSSVGAIKRKKAAAAPKKRIGFKHLTVKKAKCLKVTDKALVVFHLNSSDFLICDTKEGTFKTIINVILSTRDILKGTKGFYLLKDNASLKYITDKQIQSYVQSAYNLADYNRLHYPETATQKMPFTKNEILKLSKYLSFKLNSYFMNKYYP